MDRAYLILLVDRKHAKFFILRGNSVERIVEKHPHEYVPQNVKHGDDTWDATDKIFRHIQNHLHRYLEDVMKQVVDFIGKEHIDGAFIGSHRTLFSTIQKHAPLQLKQRILGYVVTDLKMPFNAQLEKIKKEISTVEQKPSFAHT